MTTLKKLMIIASIVVLAIVNVLNYWNQHLYFEAEEIGVTEEKIDFLEKAGKFYPLNDLVFFELGKAYHDLGVNSIGEEGRSSIHLQKSMNQLSRSLRINPTSYFGHFYLAQSFHNMSFNSPSYEVKAHKEFRKAAYLAGQNTEILYEVGKIFLSQWPNLSEEDKDFTVDILNKVVQGKDRERIQSLFNIWEINVNDYEVMDRIFLADAQIYRDFAKFLGERSHSLKERQRYLAKAEFLEFRRAKDTFEAGEYARFYYRFKEAQTHFQSCLNILDNIQFYQDLSPSQEQIELSEFEELQKQAQLSLVKSYLDLGEEINNIEGFLWDYLAEEDRDGAIDELENYLKRRGIQDEETNSIIEDLDHLSLQLYLSLKQGRFRDNMRVGRNLWQSFVVVPEGQENQFVRILKIVGESFQRVDFIYDSNDFYKRALDLDPRNLEVLTKLQNNYQRLNAKREIQKIDDIIKEIVTPHEVDINRTIYKGQIYRRDMVLDGSRIKLDLLISKGRDEQERLISVIFNGRVVFEEYLKGDKVSFSVETEVGENVIQVIPVNRGMELIKITYE